MRYLRWILKLKRRGSCQNCYEYIILCDPRFAVIHTDRPKLHCLLVGAQIC